MKKAILTLSLCIIAVFMFAQSTVNNAGFEAWDGLGGTSEEPQSWNSFKTANGTWSTFAQQQINRSNLFRPGSVGTYSAYIYSKVIASTTANGNITTGQVTMGSTTPTSSSNFNYSKTSDANFSETFTAYPDSFAVWIRFEPVTSSDLGRFHAIIHNAYDVRDPIDGTSATHVKAEATLNFPKTNNAWVRKSVPFIYNTNVVVPAYILVSFTTNQTPGQGSANDKLYIDDIEFIYNVNLSTLTISQGTLVPSFSPNVTNYSVTLPFGSTVTPTVDATTQSSNATRVITPAVDITSANIADRTTTVVVTGGDGVTTKTYSVVFGIELSNDASLAELASSVGSLSPTFNPDTLNYQVILPHGTITTPVTTATPNNPSSNKVITDATDVNSLIQSERTTAIHVTAPNGTTTRDYSILFNVNPLNNDATLDSIFVSQIALPNFHSDTLYYIYTLPYGTTIVPDVEVSRTDTNARVLITPATSIPGTTTIFVEAQDTTFTTTYIINFLLANPSNDASLVNLKVNDTLIAGFAPTTFIYYKHLSQETIIVPTVTAQANHPDAIVNIIQASTLTGQAEVNVTAQDGITTSSYNVNFDLNLGVENNTSLEINMYPMPANDYVIFNISESLKNSKLKILSTTSQVVFESILTETYNSINISELSVGYYLFTIENNANKENGYLIINR